VKALVFSLWVMLEAAGGYLGSTLGGLAYDSVGQGSAVHTGTFRICLSE
jgi:hypothetical protein